jgi:signal transduction histidine kinase
MRARRIDIVLAVVVAAIQTGATYGAGTHQDPVREYDVFAALLLAAAGLVLVFRLRWPSATLVGAFVATLAYWSIGYPRGPAFLGLIVAFATAIWAGRRRAAAAVAVAGVVAFPWLGPLLGRGNDPDLGDQIAVLTWLIGLSTASELLRARKVRRTEAQRLREAEAQRQADEERMRIARELHDVLAHNISLINVQSGVALHLMDQQPEQARVALEAIKHASKEALGELRHVLGLLRGADEAAPRAPGGLDGLDGLVERAWTAGLVVRVERTGSRRELPAAVDLAAYRIVQEAVTNTLRHAGAGPVTSVVHLDFSPDALAIRVDDDGRGATGATGHSGGSGTGLAGMRERVATLGGELRTGPRPGGGFRVEARLPLGDAPEAEAPEEPAEPATTGAGAAE